MQEKVKLSNGQEYVITTLDVGDLIEVEKKFGSTTLNSGSMEQMVFWAYLALRKQHKDMTLEKLYKLMDAPFITNGGLTELFAKMTHVNGWDQLVKNEGSPAIQKSPSKS